MPNRLIFFFAVLLTGICQKLHAFGMPSSKPLPQTIAQSQIIALVSLTAYHSDISPTNSMAASSAPIGAVGTAIFTDHPMKPAGQYTFRVISALKGSVSASLSVHLPYVLGLYYPGSGFSIQNGSKFILFLNTNSNGQLTPTDATTPFVPLEENATPSKTRSNDIEESVYALMLASCRDAKFRETESYFFRNLSGSFIVAGLTPYIDDLNFHTRDNVLACMANNQQVAAIPRISMLDQEMEARGGEAEAASAFRSYQNPEALPYLNPLLFSSSYYLRLTAIEGIDNIAGRSSIPYLMLAVRDPDRQGIIQQSAYGMLHQLIPSLGEAYGSGYFAQHRATETKRLYAWWSDELLGKHLKPGEHPAIPAELPSMPTLLNPLLFIPDTATRRAVVDKLARLGDKSSIPYLVLALQDPDAQAPDVNVSYVSYKTLHRLIPALGPAEASGKFDANPEAAKQPIYHWWQEELLGKHLPQ
jgi:hypothetical protein